VHTANFDQELTVGSSPVVHIAFSGALNDKMVGFYRSKYTHNGKEQYAECFAKMVSPFLLCSIWGLFPFPDLDI
jgi:hypothetical protein